MTILNGASFKRERLAKRKTAAYLHVFLNKLVLRITVPRWAVSDGLADLCKRFLCSDRTHLLFPPGYTFAWWGNQTFNLHHKQNLRKRQHLQVGGITKRPYCLPPQLSCLGVLSNAKGLYICVKVQKNSRLLVQLRIEKMTVRTGLNRFTLVSIS